MITKILKHQFRTMESLKYLMNYEVYDQDDSANEFGFICLRKDGTVIFVLLEQHKELEVDEMEIIHDFMLRLHKIHVGDELNTLRDEYYYNERT